MQVHGSTKTNEKSHENHGAQHVETGEPAEGLVIEVLKSPTSREILKSLFDRPMAASEIAEQGGWSLRSVGYHLIRLQEVDLIEVVENTESDRDGGMKRYAPTRQTVIMVAGDKDALQDIGEALELLATN